MIASWPFVGVLDFIKNRPIGMLGLAFQSSVGTAAFGQASASRAIVMAPNVHRRWRAALVRCRRTGGPLFGPFEQIAEAIDDAAAVASKFRAGLLPPVIVKRAPGHAQHLGCFVNNQEYVASFVDHEATPIGCPTSVRNFSMSV